jgi:hypothetical protein
MVKSVQNSASKFVLLRLLMPHGLFRLTECFETIEGIEKP